MCKNVKKVEDDVMIISTDLMQKWPDICCFERIKTLCITFVLEKIVLNFLHHSVVIRANLNTHKRTLKRLLFFDKFSNFNKFSCV